MDKTTKILAIVTGVFIILAVGGILYTKSTSNPTTMSLTTQPTLSPFDTSKNYIATMSTTMGDIKLQLDAKDSPKAVQNFVTLSQRGYYNNLTFHRIAKDFVIQGGDPTGTGSGGESIFGKTFADEMNPSLDIYKTGYVKGVLAMANSGANTNGSQFFIMIADHKDLPANYTIFGKVISGQEVADKIGQADLGKNSSGAPVTDGKPVNTINIKSVSIAIS